MSKTTIPVFLNEEIDLNDFDTLQELQDPYPEDWVFFNVYGESLIELWYERPLTDEEKKRLRRNISRSRAALVPPKDPLLFRQERL